MYEYMGFVSISPLIVPVGAIYIALLVGIENGRRRCIFTNLYGVTSMTTLIFTFIASGWKVFLHDCITYLSKYLSIVL
jgi:hypothetical protein